MFYCVNNGCIQMPCSSLQDKRPKKKKRKRGTFKLCKPSGNTEYSQCIKNFKPKLKQGPFYVRVVCNRCHYDGNVIIFKSGKYSHDFITKINTNVSSFNHQFNICKT